jgi:cytosine/adenosine deaminase-related metal-dependent hydrolase
MVRQVFSNALIFEGDELELTRGYIVVRGGVIEEIGEGSPPKRGVDLKRGFVLPPFINAHTHVADAVAKELYLGKTQPQVVGPKGAKFRAIKKPERELVGAIRTEMEEMFRTGTLAHCDFREGGSAGAKVLQKARYSRVKSVILGRISKRSELEDILRVCDGLGLPSLDALNPQELERVAREVSNAKKILALHVAETKEAQEASMKAYRKSEVARALALHPSFVVHATCASDGDLVSMRKANTPVVFCARANSLLGVGTPPIRRALKLGVRFCLGTDNVAVCQPDMFSELAFAWACMRRADSKVGGDEALALLRAATIEPLKIFDLPWSGIQENAPATFMVLSRGHNLLNLTEPYAGLVNRARADNLAAIFVNGKRYKPRD